MSAITTHVLDTSRGRPAAGLHVALEQAGPSGEWHRVGEGVTDPDGRLRTLMSDGARPVPGLFRLIFDTRAYFESHATTSFYPHVVITFEVTGSGAHYHVPLLLSAFGYTTYRGS
jgi:5-hydroxyisourate hydrolase